MYLHFVNSLNCLGKEHHNILIGGGWGGGGSFNPQVSQSDKIRSEPLFASIEK